MEQYYEERKLSQKYLDNIFPEKSIFKAIKPSLFHVEQAKNIHL